MGCTNFAPSSIIIIIYLCQNNDHSKVDQLRWGVPCLFGPEDFRRVDMLNWGGQIDPIVIGNL